MKTTCRCDHLSGFNVCNRYLIVLYYQVRPTLNLQVLPPQGWTPTTALPGRPVIPHFCLHFRLRVYYVL
jgi:hypothetical protein